MIIKFLDSHEAERLLPLIEGFMAESQWNWTYNKERSLQTIFNYTNSSETCIIVVTDEDGFFAGFAMLAYDVDFSDEKIGYISKFYISPKFRKTLAGRTLAISCAYWFDSIGCIDSFATKTASINGQDNAFMNLLGKYGWSPCGETLVRHKK